MIVYVVNVPQKWRISLARCFTAITLLHELTKRARCRGRALELDAPSTAMRRINRIGGNSVLVISVPFLHETPSLVSGAFMCFGRLAVVTPTPFDCRICLIVTTSVFVANLEYNMALPK